jgi:UDP-N-acetylmuramyl pentapeptide synthase
VSFGIKSEADFRGSALELRSRGSEFLLNSKHRYQIKNRGLHNVANALAAIAVARIFGLAHKDIILRLASFDFPPGRCNMVRFDDLCLIDDTYNSNPFSLEHALNTLANIKVKGRKIFVMGDMLELGADKEIFHGKAGKKAAKISDVFITVGRLSRISALEAGKSGMNEKNLFSCADSREAGKILFDKVLPGIDDIVLVKGSRSMRMEEVFNKHKKK